MTYIAKPRLHHPLLKPNGIGFTRRDYEGKVSTCAPAAATTRSRRRSSRPATTSTCRRIAWRSSPASAVRRRRPTISLAPRTASTASTDGCRRSSPAPISPIRDLIYLGVSGDGDSASIGLGQFAHSIRRGVNMTYIVENNGVYGLTKGQFSATSDKGSKSKKGVVNTDQPIELVALALQLGASFVARSFSGDKAQLAPLIEAAILHKGPAFIDVLSPCVQFNNHAGSTKSYDYIREHNSGGEPAGRDHVEQDEIVVDYEPGEIASESRSTTVRCCSLRKVARRLRSDRQAGRHRTALQRPPGARRDTDGPDLRRSDRGGSPPSTSTRSQPR